MKKYLLFLLLMSICFYKIQAQTNAYFVYNADSYGLNKIIKTADNNYVGVGTFWNGGFVAKFDQQFNIIWYKQLMDRPMNFCNGLVETNSGNYVFIMDYADTSFLFKYNSQGNLLYTKYFSSISSNNFAPKRITKSITGDGLVLAGGACNLSNYLMRLDDTGNILWQYQYYNNSSNCANSTPSEILTESNRYVYSFNANKSTSTLLGLQIMFVDDNGNLLDNNSFDDLFQIGNPENIIHLQNGKYVVSWNLNNQNRETYFVIIDSNFTKASAKTFTVNGTYNLETMKEFENNKILIAGTVFISGSSNVSSAFYFLIDDNGQLIWAKSGEQQSIPNGSEDIHCLAKGLDNSMFAFGSASMDGMFGVKINSNGDGFCNNSTTITTTLQLDSSIGSTKIMYKNSSLNIVSNSFTFTNHDTIYSKNIFCGQINNFPLAISTNSENNQFEIYPNPFENELLVTAKQSIPVNISIYSIIGQLIFQNENCVITNIPLAIDLKNCQKGQYLIILKDKNNYSQQFSFFKK